MSIEVSRQKTKPILVIQLREVDDQYEPNSEDFTNGVTLSAGDTNYIHHGFTDYPTLKILSRYPTGDIVDALIDRFYNEDLSCIVADVRSRNYRRQPAKQMTLKEIEEALGYKVEIIKENF